MRAVIAVITILAILPIAPVQAAAEEPLVLMEVCPGLPAEFIRLENNGDAAVELGGWSIGDGEGTITFPEGMSIGAGDSLALAYNATIASDYISCVIIEYKDALLSKKGVFQLANDGDQVILTSPQGSIRDMFVYGDAGASSPWVGKPFPGIAKNNDALRSDPTRRSASAWVLSVPGRTALPQYDVECAAGVFVSPEDAGTEVLAFVEAAGSSLSVCTYQYDHPELTAILALKARQGVDVSIIVEGDPVGGVEEDSASQLLFLEDAGVNVSVMLSREGYRRYDFLHAKYMVADARDVVIMSENLVENSFRKNRGWGAIISSPEAAAFLQEVFNDDSDPAKGDVVRAHEAFDAPEDFAAAENGSPHQSKVEMTQCSARLVLSPDNSLAALGEMMRGASHRLFVEQMQADFEDLQEMGLTDALTDAVANGAAVQVLLDSSLEKKGGSNQDFVSRTSATLQAKLCSGEHEFVTIHNKGIIADETALISSINLGATSIGQNRELGVVIRSQAISDKLAQVFLDDWKDDSLAPDVRLPWQEIEVSEGTAVTLDGSLCRDSSLPLDFAWDIDGDGESEMRGQRVQCVLGVGAHSIALTVTDSAGNGATATVLVNVRANAAPSLLPAMALAVLLPISFLAWKRIKKK
jgi:phosphatidylserine/phosphatidylglycerophosphate/cardiolipin synthase-like enzyme